MLSLISTATAALLLSSSVDASTASCKPTSNWPGWKGIKHAFIFGDSYTQTGFNETGIQPTPTNPLGNPQYPGWTSANGPNWIDYLTVKYNASNLLTYNLAYGGATIHSSLVQPWRPDVSSVADQVQKLYFPAYAGKPASAPWTSKDSIFAVFDGINDVGNSWWIGEPATTILQDKIFAIYRSLVDSLYYSGARNFAFLNVPPTDRSPLMIGQGPEAQAALKVAIKKWNERVTAMAKAIKKERSDVNIFTVDANKVFTKVLDKPKSYKQTALYKNTTAFCEAYQNGTPAPDTLDPSCAVPVNQYFWLNSLHPTYPVHDALAQEASKVLAGGPNIC